MIESALAVPVGWALALLLDRLLGEPRRLHPLVLFGRAAARLERRLNTRSAGALTVLRGAVAWALLVLPAVLACVLLRKQVQVSVGAAVVVFDAAVLYLCLGWRSMQEHVTAVEQADDLEAARAAAGRIVSRDTAEADQAGVLSAALESTLENSGDALFASLFWFAVAGPAGALLHRLANTLDAMWGYRTTRFLYFGRAAARLDDALGFPPAQLTALSFAVVTGRIEVLGCWWRQGWHWKSINAGSVMAAGAAALGVQLGGAARYRGVVQARPMLGQGRAPLTEDLSRAFVLVRRSWQLWLLVAISLAALNQVIA